MKLVTFRDRGDDAERLGAVLDNGTVAVLEPARYPPFISMLALIDAGREGVEAARDALASAPRRSADAVTLCAPLPRPRQIRDALSFEKHFRQARARRQAFGQPGPTDPEAVEVPQVWYDQPINYKGNRFSVVGPETDVRWPAGETRLDFELELAAVIGHGGRDIPEQTALDHVFGYVIFNDMSARDHQIREMAGGLGPAKGKDFDTGNILGPWLVTADEVGDPQALRMRARVNGVTWADGSSAEMHHGFARIIAHVSRDETLHPGEVIGSGTLGNGCGLEHGRFLAPGDEVELEIERLGILRNRIGPRR
ncbi:MAG: fumarylacetoacetate hydrolase family protein [Rhodobacteraceae bacterium]|nr:fumarylacetoacetate hydrolase family protein [Paracoccaceae bacterium]